MRRDVLDFLKKYRYLLKKFDKYFNQVIKINRKLTN